MNVFMMMMTQNGKLLYISENAAEYLGHSMVGSVLFLHCGLNNAITYHFKFPL